MAAITRRSLPYDSWLVLTMIALLGMGLIMVASASFSYAVEIHKPVWYFTAHHLVYLTLGFIGCAVVTFIPLSFWRALSFPLLAINLGLLVLLLIPGISREVNGSVRWLFVGPISIQVSELTKLTLVMYMAAYLAQYEKAVQTSVAGFVKPVIILGIVAALLILEPDFGATVVISTTVLGMLFIAGVPLRQFLVLFLLALGALSILAVASPYRIQRLTSFLNPWKDQFNSGYQLTQSLIAFGRGGWFGMGLGNSVQKLLYLPEPHTDFIYAVIAEEFGLIGALGILFLFILLVWRILKLGKEALLAGNRFAGFMANGIGLWFGLQAIINIGVNVGVLPTKGLTLPFISYGGCSLIVGLLAVGILLRIEFELFMRRYGWDH